MQVTKTSRAELEEAARAQYRERYAHTKPAEPRVVNADALVLFTGSTARVVEWRSVRYHAPPRLPFPTAVRLLVAANTIADLAARGFAPLVLERVAETAATLLHQTLTPKSFLRRMTRRVRRNPFLGDALELGALVQALLDVPDGAIQQPTGPTKPVTVDLIDDLATFADALPAWCGADGLPMSWSHYVYGTRHIARSLAREDLRRAAATRVAQADKDGWRSYESEQRAAAGWH